MFFESFFSFFHASLPCSSVRFNVFFFFIFTSWIFFPQDFGAKRKIGLKGSRQRKKEAAKRPVGKDLYMNQDHLNWREFKKQVNKTFQKQHLDWPTYKRNLKKSPFGCALSDKKKNMLIYLWVSWFFVVFLLVEGVTIFFSFLFISFFLHVGL